MGVVHAEQTIDLQFVVSCFCHQPYQYSCDWLDANLDKRDDEESSFSIVNALIVSTTMKWIVFSIFFLAFAATVSVIDELSALSKLWANVESSLSAVNEVANIQTASTGVASTPNGMSQGQVAELFGSLNHFLQGKEEKKIISERIRPIVNESNTRLPQLPPSRTNRSERILVVYSGPTDVMDPAIPIKKFNIPDKKTELYRVNFEYFLEHGVQCKTQDTMLVVTQVIADVYRSRVEELHRQCQEHGHSVILALRNNTCLDLETVRVALYDGYVDVPSYDYFVCTCPKVKLTFACSIYTNCLT